MSDLSNARRVEEQLQALETYLRNLGSALVCYSGGVDSAFVLAMAHRVLGPRAIGMTAVSPSLAVDEKALAEKVAEAIGADYRLVHSNEIHNPDYQKNATDRCFYCKSELYSIAAAKKIEWGVDWVLNGTNVDDLGDYRPGLEAASQAQVKSPLVDLGLTKADVRAGAKAIGLSVWDKPAAACLSSRIPFGTSVTPDRLQRIGGFESALKAMGFRVVRVRYHGQGNSEIARIELDLDELARAAKPGLREEILQAGIDHGFRYVTLDLGGYRMGSHNEVLGGGRLVVLS